MDFFFFSFSFSFVNSLFKVCLIFGQFFFKCSVIGSVPWSTIKDHKYNTKTKHTECRIIKGISHTYCLINCSTDKRGYKVSECIDETVTIIYFIVYFVELIFISFVDLERHLEFFD